MNISEKTKLDTGKTSLTPGQVKKHFKRQFLGKPKYEYFGKRISRGIIAIYIPNDKPYKAIFRERNGWITNIKIVNFYE